MIMFNNDQINQILSIYNKVKEDDEYEIMFNNYKSDSDNLEYYKSDWIGKIFIFYLKFLFNF